MLNQETPNLKRVISAIQEEIAYPGEYITQLQEIKKQETTTKQQSTDKDR